MYLVKFNIAYLFTKFNNSSFSHCWDMWDPNILKNGLRDVERPLQ